MSSGGNQRLLEGHMMNEFYVYPIYSGKGNYYDASGAVDPNGGPKDGMIRTEKDLKWVQDMIAAGYSFEPQHNVSKNAIWYGEYIYADTNGDKVYGGNYDQKFTGKSMVPKFNFGIQMHAEWNGFDLSMNWGGATGFSTYWREIGQNSTNVVFWFICSSVDCQRSLFLRSRESNRPSYQPHLQEPTYVFGEPKYE